VFKILLKTGIHSSISAKYLLATSISFNQRLSAIVMSKRLLNKFFTKLRVLHSHKLGGEPVFLIYIHSFENRTFLDFVRSIKPVALKDLFPCQKIYLEGSKTGPPLRGCNNIIPAQMKNSHYLYLQIDTIEI